MFKGLRKELPKGMPMSASPSEIRSPRMEALARLPVFFALAGKRTVVAGDSAAAAWKIELLAAAAPDVTLHRREIAGEDFAGAAIAIGAFEDEAPGAAFAAQARAAGVPVN